MRNNLVLSAIASYVIGLLIWQGALGLAASDDERLKALKRDLIDANHILHYYGIVDTYGHVSVRHPQNPNTYIMAGDLPPALVTSSNDVVDYWVNGSDPVVPGAKRGYYEKFIHGEIYRMFTDVNCVVHSHAEAVLPYTMSGVPLVPIYHMAGFLGQNVPVFDIAEDYSAEDQQDMLVSNVRFGMSLASKFRRDSNESNTGEAGHTAVLMRRHGFTTQGKDIESAVYRAIYTMINARVQTGAMELRAAFTSASAGLQANFDLEPLTDNMIEGCAKVNQDLQGRPWRLWTAEVEKSSLYINRG